MSWLCFCLCFFCFFYWLNLGWIERIAHTRYSQSRFRKGMKKESAQVCVRERKNQDGERILSSSLCSCCCNVARQSQIQEEGLCAFFPWLTLPEVTVPLNSDNEASPPPPFACLAGLEREWLPGNTLPVAGGCVTRSNKTVRASAFDLLTSGSPSCVNVTEGQ